MQISYSFYMSVFILKHYPENFAFLIFVELIARKVFEFFKNYDDF